MPSPVLTRLFAAALLAAIVASAPARAEMTEADREGARVFATCLDETGDDEDGCLEKLRRHAWYPRDDAACQTVGARIGKVFELGGIPNYRDLFKNERCARLGLPHNQIAATAGTRRGNDRPYFMCSETGMVGEPYCDSEVGRHLWHPWKSSWRCRIPVHALEEDLEDMDYMWWSSLFETERCHRLGMDYFQPEKKQ